MRITNNHSFSQSQQPTPVIDMQDDRIKMNINLPNVEGTSETL